jgi:hypothetical protein
VKRTVFPLLCRNHHIPWSQVQDPHYCLTRINSLSSAEQRSSKWEPKFTTGDGWAWGIICLPSWPAEVEGGSELPKSRGTIAVEWGSDGKAACLEQEIPRKRIGFLLKTERTVGEARIGQASSSKTKRGAFPGAINAEECLATKRWTNTTATNWKLVPQRTPSLMRNLSHSNYLWTTGKNWTFP